jgi:hypothetical protein
MEEDYLETICPYCKGTYEVINPKFLEWGILNNYNGVEPEPTTICPVCSGSGTIPTHDGIEILELVERYENVDSDGDFEEDYDDDLTEDEDEEDLSEKNNK